MSLPGGTASINYHKSTRANCNYDDFEETVPEYLPEHQLATLVAQGRALSWYTEESLDTGSLARRQTQNITWSQPQLSDGRIVKWAYCQFRKTDGHKLDESHRTHDRSRSSTPTHASGKLNHRGVGAPRPTLVTNAFWNNCRHTDDSPFRRIGDAHGCATAEGVQ